MTAAEMENERLRMRVAELEKSDNAVHKVFNMLDNAIQGIDDRLEKSNGFFEKVRLSNRRMGLLGFRTELIQTFGEEEEDGGKKNICGV